MKKILLLLTILLIGCTGHQPVDNSDLEAINKIASKLFELNDVNGKVEDQWWPVEILRINPESLRKDGSGIYIQLNSFFVSESGLFIPAQGTVVTISKGYGDPSYVLLKGNVYSYHIKG